MSHIAVVAVIGSVVLANWAHRLLVDEDRYLRAVTPLATSARFSRLAGTVVALGTRHRVGWRRRLSPAAGRALGRATAWGMQTRSFPSAWMVGNRRLHRHRNTSVRIAVVMIALAAMGTVLTFWRSSSSIERSSMP